jgi:hypothetical protein
MATPPSPPLPLVHPPLLGRLTTGDWRKDDSNILDFSNFPDISIDHLLSGPPPSGPLASDIHLAHSLEEVVRQALCEKCSNSDISQYVEEIAEKDGNSFGNTLNTLDRDPNKCPKCSGSKMPSLLPDR